MRTEIDIFENLPARRFLKHEQWCLWGGNRGAGGRVGRKLHFPLLLLDCFFENLDVLLFPKLISKWNYTWFFKGKSLTEYSQHMIQWPTYRKYRNEITHWTTWQRNAQGDRQWFSNKEIDRKGTTAAVKHGPLLNPWLNQVRHAPATCPSTTELSSVTLLSLHVGEGLRPLPGLPAARPHPEFLPWEALHSGTWSLCHHWLDGHCPHDPVRSGRTETYGLLSTSAQILTLRLAY